MPIVELQGKDHRVVLVNAAFCGLVGKTRVDLLGLPFAEIVPGGGKCVAVLDRVFASGEAATHVYEDHSSSNPAFWMYAMWPRLDPTKQPAGVIIHMTTSLEFRDTAVAINEALLIAGLRQHELTTEAETLNTKLKKEIAGRRAVESALRAAVDDLKVAQARAALASAAKDNFLATLSHELRTPLTPVLMMAGALREDARLPPDMRDQLAGIERGVKLEARLIDDLLDLTKLAHGKLQLRVEACDAHQLIEQAVEIVREEARVKGVRIERNFTARDGRLMADPTRFQQVIWNLLGNALKFTPRGGQVVIRTTDEKRPNNETWLRIEVTDTGRGIDSAQFEHIFLAFDQGGLSGNHGFGGVGLGLSIARAAIDLSGGRIFVQSPGLNLGATFAIELPTAKISAPDLSHQGSSSAQGTGAATHTLRPVPRLLLLVEDHEITLRTLAGLLRKDGHVVTTACSVAEALSAASGSKFDFVISDLGLPDGSGIELMGKLRALYGLQGIALTGYGSKEDIARSDSAGFIKHLVKPVSIADLREAIASLP